MIKYIKNSRTYIRYSNWEYWPIWLVYLPVVPLFLYFVLRTKRFFFFSNVNPLFKTGDLMGASKSKILNKIPKAYRPLTIINRNQPNRVALAIEEINSSNLQFPLIVKPDIGERGLLVELIQNEKELGSYLSANNIDIIIQEYVKLPKECGIFYIRKPSQEKGQIVSVGLKKYFDLEGDGQSTIRELMLKNPRYKLQIDRYELYHQQVLSNVLPLGEVLVLDPIGNHSRGTIFSDGNHLISQKLDDLFDRINDEMEDVYYGRFDIKYNDWDELLEGKNFKILEMNGVSSEPIHIYDNSISIRDKYKSFYSLWRTIFEISNIQKKRGVLPIKSKKGLQVWRNYNNYIKSINLNWRQGISVKNLKIS